jgi:hypothetical protein
METVIGAARHVRRFGLAPKIALCTHSQFGNMDTDTGRRMRAALEMLDAREPDFAYEGEMNIDAALDQSIRDRLLPNSRYEGAANVLVFASSRGRLGRPQHPEGQGGGAGGRADPDGHGQQGAYRHARDHRARPAEHVRHRGDAGRALRLTGADFFEEIVSEPSKAPIRSFENSAAFCKSRASAAQQRNFANVICKIPSPSSANSANLSHPATGNSVARTASHRIPTYQCISGGRSR